MVIIYNWWDVGLMRKPWWCLDYRSLGSVFTLKKRIIFFSKNESVYQFWNDQIFHHLPWYCDMSGEIIQGVAYDNYDDFQHVNFIFSQIFISLFWGLFNDETNLRVRKYWIILETSIHLVVKNIYWTITLDQYLRVAPFGDMQHYFRE
jgi:hypothetical protein